MMKFNYLSLKKFQEYQNRVLKTPIENIPKTIKNLKKFEIQYKFNSLDHLFIINKIILVHLYQKLNQKENVREETNKFLEVFSKTKILINEGFTVLKKILGVIKLFDNLPKEISKEILEWDFFLEGLQDYFLKSGCVCLPNTSIQDIINKNREVDITTPFFTSYVNQKDYFSVFVNHNVNSAKYQNRFSVKDFGNVSIFNYSTPILHFPFLELGRIGYNVPNSSYKDLKHELIDGVHKLSIGNVKREIDVKKNFVSIRDIGGEFSIFNFSKIPENIKIIGDYKILNVSKNGIKWNRLMLKGDVRMLLLGVD